MTELGKGLGLETRVASFRDFGHTYTRRETDFNKFLFGRVIF